MPFPKILIISAFSLFLTLSQVHAQPIAANVRVLENIYGAAESFQTISNQPQSMLGEFLQAKYDLSRSQKALESITRTFIINRYLGLIRY